MSISALLIPLGMASIAAVRAALTDLKQQRRTQETPLRVSDPHLIARSLEALGATDIQVTQGEVSARTAVGTAVFRPVGTVYAGVLVGASDTASATLVGEVEERAGHLAQARTAALAKSQAEQLGFRMIEETTEQGTINYVFEEI